jgi:hypothetical protein
MEKDSPCKWKPNEQVYYIKQRDFRLKKTVTRDKEGHQGMI